jgi:ankyrin repeat protein
VNTEQWTALHLACYNDRKGVVRILLAQPGMDCNPLIYYSGGRTCQELLLKVQIVKMGDDPKS